MKSDIMLVLLIVLHFLFVFGESILRCSQINKSIKSDYYLLQTCTSSVKNIIAQTYAQDLDYCKQFSSRYKGLAFNFAEPGR